MISVIHYICIKKKNNMVYIMEDKAVDKIQQTILYIIKNLYQTRQELTNLHSILECIKNK